MELTSLIGVKIIAFNGCQITATDQDGQPVADVDVPPGPVELSAYQPLVNWFGPVTIGNCLVVTSKEGRNRVAMPDPETMFATAANPDFIPSSEYRNLMMVQKMVDDAVRQTLAKQPAPPVVAKRPEPEPVLKATKLPKEPAGQPAETVVNDAAE